MCTRNQALSPHPGGAHAAQADLRFDLFGAGVDARLPISDVHVRRAAGGKIETSCRRRMGGAAIAAVRGQHGGC